VNKNTPHCKLSVIQSLVVAGKVRATLSALTGGAALGLSFIDIVEVIVSLSPSDFHKSMTTYADHRVWQDVYRPTTSAGAVYLKLTVLDDVLILSFKEL